MLLVCIRLCRQYFCKLKFREYVACAVDACRCTSITWIPHPEGASCEKASTNCYSVPFLYLCFFQFFTVQNWRHILPPSPVTLRQAHKQVTSNFSSSYLRSILNFWSPSLHTNKLNVGVLQMIPECILT
jgi:hypothetical protein